MSDQKNNPFKITIIMADGSLDGLRKVEKSDWDGMAIICPFINFSETRKKHSEFAGSGVYLLVGHDNDSDEAVIYIGMTDDFSARLRPHHDAFGKDFYQQIIIFTRNKYKPLNSAENSYLEHHLIKLAKVTKHFQVKNLQEPKEPNMSEADKVPADEFLRQMLQILSIMGISAFKKVSTKSVVVSNSEGSKNIGNVENSNIKFTLTRNGCKAIGHQTIDGFVVQKGSTANKKNSETLSLSREEKRKHFHNNGLFVEEGDFYLFTEDHEFNSPSLAASIVSGMNENGLAMWKDDKGVTLKKYLDRAAQES